MDPLTQECCTNIPPFCAKVMNRNVLPPIKWCRIYDCVKHTLDTTAHLSEITRGSIIAAMIVCVLKKCQARIMTGLLYSNIAVSQYKKDLCFCPHSLSNSSNSSSGDKLFIYSCSASHWPCLPVTRPSSGSSDDSI